MSSKWLRHKLSEEGDRCSTYIPLLPPSLAHPPVTIAPTYMLHYLSRAPQHSFWASLLTWLACPPITPGAITQFPTPTPCPMLVCDIASVTFVGK